ncbi:MAG TPA: hypothetical protein DIU39_09285 [Flavobacteriales bacterium]|nr:hypothetical protein [Flavobacteriales bacterium]|tara:strand:- start:156892 stop:158175 length:1284 start_codon:yes stop_codon:yes gene_type:complete
MQFIFGIILTLTICLNLMGQKKTQSKIIFFKTGQSTLSQQDKQDLMNWLAQFENNNVKFIVKGYCDTVGSAKINEILSKKRALSVEKLIKTNNHKWTIEIMAFGETNLPFPKNSPKNKCVIIESVGFDANFAKNLGINKQNNKSDSLIDATGSSDIVFENDTTIYLSKGTIIEIESGTFYPIKVKDINFEFTEIFSLCDMLKNNIITRDDEGNCLLSSGMVYIRATYDGEEIQPNKGKFIRLKIPIINSGENTTKEMSMYGAFKEGDKTIWRKVSSVYSYADENNTYYLFKTDSLYNFNLDISIAEVKCEKTGPKLKLPKKFNFVTILQTYPPKKYLATGIQRKKRVFQLDELRYDYNPYIIISGINKDGLPVLAEGKLSRLPFRKKANMYIVKKKHFKQLPPGYINRDNLNMALCGHLNKLEESFK